MIIQHVSCYFGSGLTVTQTISLVNKTRQCLAREHCWGESCGKMWNGHTDLAKSRSASLDMVMLVRFCCRTKMFLHIFLMPDSLILLKYWAPLMRIQEIRWPRPGREKKTLTRTHRYDTHTRIWTYNWPVTVNISPHFFVVCSFVWS